jgi:uncharacterized protein YcbK (DUF882 family)
MDPRVLAQGTTVADVNAQVAMSLRLVELHSEARRLEKQLSDEQEQLESKGEEISGAEQQRLDRVNAILTELKTSDEIYPQPMLTDQISYLFNMINTADQAPGKEAEDRYEELSNQLRRITASGAE